MEIVKTCSLDAVPDLIICITLSINLCHKFAEQAMIKIKLRKMYAMTCNIQNDNSASKNVFV